VKVRRILAIYMMGSYGDIHPFIVLGKELHRIGWQPTFFSNETFRDIVEAEGFSFVSITDKDLYEKTYKSPNVWTNKGLLAHTCRYHFPALLPTFNKLNSFHKKNPIDLIIGTNIFSGASWLAEKLKIPYVRVSLNPFSDKDVLVSELSWLKNPKKFIVKSVWFIAKHISIFKFDRKMIKPIINPIRKELGLSKISFKEIITKITETSSLAMYPRWYISPKETRSNIKFTGFPCTDPIDNNARTTLDNILKQVTEKPIAFAPGSAVYDVEDYLLKAQYACEQVKRTGIFVTRSMSECKRISPNMIVMNYVDFSYLFSKCELVCHHGGIGTTAQCIKAGVPQIIRPLAYDQPDNGRRIKNLGLGEVVNKNCNQFELSLIIKKIIDTRSYNLAAKALAGNVSPNAAATESVRAINEFYLSEKYIKSISISRELE